jgi:hypothetical protein
VTNRGIHKKERARQRGKKPKRKRGENDVDPGVKCTEKTQIKNKGAKGEKNSSEYYDVKP